MAGEVVIRVRRCSLCCRKHLAVGPWTVCHVARVAACSSPRRTIRGLRPLVLVLLETLLLRRGRITSYAELADALWPLGEEPTNYRGDIDKYVHLLREYVEIRTNHGRGWEITGG